MIRIEVIDTDGGVRVVDGQGREATLGRGSSMTVRDALVVQLEETGAAKGRRDEQRNRAGG